MVDISSLKHVVVCHNYLTLNECGGDSYNDS